MVVTCLNSIKTFGITGLAQVFTLSALKTRKSGEFSFEQTTAKQVDVSI